MNRRTLAVLTLAGLGSLPAAAAAQEFDPGPMSMYGASTAIEDESKRSLGLQGPLMDTPRQRAKRAQAARERQARLVRQRRIARQRALAND